MEEELETIKIFLVGDSGVGCNQLSKIFVGLSFDSDPAVLTWNYRQKTIIINGQNYRINICNGPGQEMFRSLMKIHSKNSDIVLFVYDITDRRTFDDLDILIKIINEEIGNNYLGAIIGNKYDLYEKSEVDIYEGKQFAESKGYKFLLASVKDNPHELISFISYLVEIYISGSIFNPQYNSKKYISKENTIKKKKFNENIFKWNCFNINKFFLFKYYSV